MPEELCVINSKMWATLLHCYNAEEFWNNEVLNTRSKVFCAEIDCQLVESKLRELDVNHRMFRHCVESWRKLSLKWEGFDLIQIYSDLHLKWMRMTKRRGAIFFWFIEVEPGFNGHAQGLSLFSIIIHFINANSRIRVIKPFKCISSSKHFLP